MKSKRPLLNSSTLCTQVKSAMDCSQHNMRKVTSWQQSQHLQELASFCSASGKIFKKLMSWAEDEHSVWTSVAKLMADPSSTLAKHCRPPFLLATAFSEDESVQKTYTSLSVTPREPLWQQSTFTQTTLPCHGSQLDNLPNTKTMEDFHRRRGLEVSAMRR